MTGPESHQPSDYQLATLQGLAGRWVGQGAYTSRSTTDPDRPPRSVQTCETVDFVPVTLPQWQTHCGRTEEAAGLAVVHRARECDTRHPLWSATGFLVLLPIKADEVRRAELVWTVAGRPAQRSIGTRVEATGACRSLDSFLRGLGAEAAQLAGSMETTDVLERDSALRSVLAAEVRPRWIIEVSLLHQRPETRPEAGFRQRTFLWMEAPAPSHGPRRVAYAQRATSHQNERVRISVGVLSKRD